MSWNPAQQAMLEAMGYTLWRHAGAAAAPAATPVPDAPITGADTLLRALQRAAGGADLSSLALPPLASLRGDARAKRALWPRLRALRRR